MSRTLRGWAPTALRRRSVGSTFVVSAFAWMAGLVVEAGLRYREVLGLGVFALVFVAVALGARTLGGAATALIAPFVWRGVNLVAARWGQRALPKRVLSRRNFPWWGWAGLAVMVGEWVLAWNRFAFIAPVQRFTYIPLWMGLIVALNGLVYKRSGHSPLTHETKSYLTLFPVSAAFWWFFEYLNRYVWNWFYVNVLDDIATGNWSRIVRFAVASLLCGLFWEMWNINSFTKWIYAIPYVHRFQYFEMPLLGLFGYIPFGIECLVITDAWMKLRPNN